MAVKYTRGTDPTARQRISKRLGAREPARRGGLFSFQKGGGGMILSLAIVIVALMLYQGVVDRMQADPVPPQIETGVGTVVGKVQADPEALGEQPMLQLRVETAGGVVHEVWVPTDPESWERTLEGEKLEVEYIAQRDGGFVRVQRLRAAPPEQ